MFIDTQNWIDNTMAGLSRPKDRDPTHARKANWCEDCAKQGWRVKMETSSRKERWGYSVYEVLVHACPACGKESLEHEKVRGRGRSGVDSR